MNNLSNLDLTARATRHALRLSLAFAIFLVSASGAEAQHKSGWSLNFTPVLLFPKDQYRFGGGADPELKYTLDFGGARLSAGGRVGAYSAKNLVGVTVMPTLRLTVPVGLIEPYASVGMGYGWLPSSGHNDFATMSRLGVVFRFSEHITLGIEGTVQRIDGSAFKFPSFGSMVNIDL